jgi:integration host factor subunit alpha
LTVIDQPPLTRQEIVDAMRKRLAISGRDARDILERFIDALTDVMESGGQVNILNFGHFQTRQSPSRPGRNPKTGESVEVKARRRPSFSMSRSLRDDMAKTFD